MAIDMSTNAGPLQLKNPLMLSPADHTHSLEQLKKAIDFGIAGITAKTYTNFSSTYNDNVAVNYLAVDENFNPICGNYHRGYSFMSRGGFMKNESDKWIDELGKAQKYANKFDAKIIASIWGDVEWMTKTSLELEQAGISAIELDAGCPSINETFSNQLSNPNIIENLKNITKAVTVPIFYKIPSKNVYNLTTQIDSCKGAGFAGATIHTRHLGFIPDIETMQPLFKTWSGIGGSWSQPLTLYRIFEARKHDPHFPLFGTNGACNADDVIRYILTGASAYQMCTEILVKGYRIISKILKDIESYMANHDVKSLRDIIGKATDSALSREEISKDKKMAYIDSEKCIKCGICVERCPWHGLKMHDEGVKCYTFNAERFDKGCVGCGLCTTVCPKQAITLGQRIISK